MDLTEFDATQALEDEFNSGEEDGCVTTGKKQVASLRVNASRGITEKIYPIYEGQNILGRHDKADIFIPAKALSKRHACIEVSSGQHFVFDYGSKNRTRRGKMILRPNVRYELTNECRLMFADIECQYTFNEDSKDSDATDSLSETGSESMLLIEESILDEEENSKRKENRGEMEEERGPEMKSQLNQAANSMVTASSPSGEKNDDSLYAADSDADDERGNSDFATPRDPNSLTFVKQTPGVMLKRLDGSLDVSGATAVNDSLQSVSDVSLRLDVTQESNTSDQSKTPYHESTALDRSESKSNTPDQKQVIGLLIHESDDDADDDSVDISMTNLIEQGAVHSNHVESSSSNSFNHQAKKKQQMGSFLKGSANEDTKNEEDKLTVGKSGLFTPEILQEVYNSKSNVVPETDRSCAQDLFSPGVVGKSSSKSDATYVVGQKYDETGDSQDYMLVATQAYGVVDSDDDETDVDESSGFDMADSSSSKGTSKVESARELHKTESSCKATATANSAGRPAARQCCGIENTKIGNLGNRDLNEINVAEQECDTLRLEDSDENTSTIPRQISLQNESTVTEESTLQLHWDSGNVEQEAKKIVMCDVEQEAKTIPLGDVEQEAKTIAMCDVEQEAKTIPLDDVEQEAKTIPLDDVEQEAKTIAMCDVEQEAKTIPLDDVEQEAKTIPLDDVEQEAKTIPLDDVEQEAKTIPLDDVEQEAKTIPLGDVEHEAKTVLDDVEQEAKTIPLGDVETKFIAFDKKNVDVTKSATKELSVPIDEAATQAYCEVATIIPNSSTTLPGASCLQLPVWSKGGNLEKTATNDTRESDERQAYSYENVCATQAYGVRESSLENDANEVIAESQTDNIEGNTQLYGLFDQPTLLYDDQQDSNSESKFLGVDECATQAYGLQDTNSEMQPIEEKDANDDDVNEDVDEFATQAYGLQEQKKLRKDDESTDEKSNKESSSKLYDDDAATQAYGINFDSYDPSEKMIMESDDEGSAAEEYETQAYGFADASPGAAEQESDEDAATQAYGIKKTNGEISFKKNKKKISKSASSIQEDIGSYGDQIVFVKPSSPSLSNTDGNNAEFKPKRSTRKGGPRSDKQIDDCKQDIVTKRHSRGRSVKMGQNEGESQENYGSKRKVRLLPTGKKSFENEELTNLTDSVHEVETSLASSEAEETLQNDRLSIEKKQMDASVNKRGRGRGRGKGRRVTGPRNKKGMGDRRSDEIDGCKIGWNPGLGNDAVKAESDEMDECKIGSNPGPEIDAVKAESDETIDEGVTRKRQRTNKVERTKSSRAKRDLDTSDVTKNLGKENDLFQDIEDKMESPIADGCTDDKGHVKRTRYRGRVKKSLSSESLSERTLDKEDSQKLDENDDTKLSLKDTGDDINCPALVHNDSLAGSSTGKRRKRQRLKDDVTISSNRSSVGTDSGVNIVDAVNDICSEDALMSSGSGHLHSKSPLSDYKGKSKRARNSKDGNATACSSNVKSEGKSKREITDTPKIMFTGLTDKNMEKAFVELGAEIADSVYDATHLVTDKVRRTVKFLCCLSRGIHIVEPSWLNKCRATNKFTDADAEAVKDKATENQYNFNLKRSLEKARKKRLLDGYSVCVTKSVKPDQKQMKDIIQCCGGKALAKLPKTLDDNTLLISCEEDRNEIKPALESGHAAHTAEILLTGILRQELDLKQYRLKIELGKSKGKGKRSQSKSDLETSKTSTPKRRRK